jgi:hypothetical protein
MNQFQRQFERIVVLDYIIRNTGQFLISNFDFSFERFLPEFNSKRVTVDMRSWVNIGISYKRE